MRVLEESLEQVDHNIALAFKQVEAQRNRVLELRSRGENDTSSQRLLASLICALAVYEQRREHLLERLLLAKAAGYPRALGFGGNP